MAMAMLARALSLQRANQRAKKVNPRLLSDSSTSESNGTGSLSPEHSADYIHSSRVSQSIDALYVLSCLRDGLSLVDTFASDEDSTTISMCAARLSEEKQARSSLSLNSEHACPSELAWDCFSSSSPSSRSDSTLASSLLATGKAPLMQRDDFCLMFGNDRQPILSSPSPPPGVTSDCCSFLMGRKSSHSEEDVRGFARKENERAGVIESTFTFSTQKGEKLREREKSAGIEVDNGGCRSKPGHQENDDVQRLLREGAMEAVEKQSGNPYVDFRQSMLQIMMASCGSRSRCREGDASGMSCVDSDMSIEDLLYCYLRLNSMKLYELITQAFSDTCSDLLAMEF
ncbi:hypothetical protein L7F22_013901 [Adiantum nelumboides]|nr:hypothetical protein [Adiantum nelumboides]